MSVPLSLGPLYAGYTLAHQRPVGIVGIGSSTMSAGDQTYYNRWFTKFVQRVQADHSPSPRSIVVPLDHQPYTHPGIHGYNGGQGGTASSNYLSPERLSAIQQIQPFAVLHVIGSNDMAFNVHPDDYYYRVNKAISQLDSAINHPYSNILIHAHMRLGRFDHHFNTYRDALIRTAESRANCHFIDVGAPFYGAGVPLRDHHRLLSSDNVHLTTQGHDFFHRIVSKELA